MSYEPVTNAPITATQIADVANKIQEQNSVYTKDTQYFAELYVDRQDNYGDAGLEYALSQGVYSPSELEIAFYTETDVDDTELQYIDIIVNEFEQALFDLANESDLNQPYDQVQNQIATEVENMRENTHLDSKEALDDYVGAVNDYLKTHHLTASQAEANADFLEYVGQDGKFEVKPITQVKSVFGDLVAQDEINKRDFVEGYVTVFSDEDLDGAFEEIVNSISDEKLAKYLTLELGDYFSFGDGVILISNDIL